MFIPPGYANVRLIALNTGNNQDAVVTFGVGLEAADPVEVGDEIAVAWAAELAQYVSSVWTGVNVQLVVGTSDPNAPLIYDSGAFVFGTASGDPLPPNCAYVCNKRTLRGGRKGRGRMFLPSPNESAFDGSGRISGSQKTALDADLMAFRSAVNGIDGVIAMVLLHTDETIDPDEITSMDVSLLVGQQKRRLR